MKKISIQKLSNIVKTQRNKLNLTQNNLSDLTGINRTMISRIEQMSFIINNKERS